MRAFADRFLGRVIEGIDRHPKAAGGALLGLFALTATLSLCADSVTFDETAHLASGYAAIDRGDFRMNPEHPALPKMFCAFPQWLMRRCDEIYESRAWKRGDQWAFGYEFLNGAGPGGWSPQAILRAGRLPMVLMGLLLGGVVFAWAREAWGPRGGLMALFLYALSPTILAHTRLVTTDLPAAFGFALCLWCTWRFCRRPDARRIAAAGAAMGVALQMKFSMIVLVPAVLMLLTLWVFGSAPSGPDRRTKLLRSSAVLAASLGSAWILAWGAYGFRYAASADASFSMYWPSAELESGPLAALIRLAREYRLAPESYLFGLSYVFKHSQREAFLNGAVISGGSWLYMPEAFLLKSTPAVLLLLGLAVRAWIRRSGNPSDGWSLLLPAAFYLVCSVAFGLTLGHRHLSPMYPLLFVFASSLAAHPPTGLRCRAALAALLLCHAGSSLAAFPRYLSYFNLAAGGSANGWRFLVDSNIDWGQDLGRLADWMRRSDVPEIHLAYFGTGSPEREGIAFRKVYRFMDLSPDRGTSLPGPGDRVAVSVTLLQGLYVSSPEVRDLLRMLRERLTPLDKAGDSIFIYRMPP